MGQNSKKFLDATLQIVGRDLTSQDGLILTAIMHNEMYFLPDFLAHYRKLGIKRFFIIDDQSTDGSFEFALEQKDVMVLRSDHRFGDMLTDPSGKTRRAMFAWRNTLLERFCSGQWSLHLDFDEFLELPKGLTLPKFLEQYSQTPSIIWGAMIDLYPKNWQEFEGEIAPNIHDVDWYFDAKPLLKLSNNPARKPSMIYSGARARLRYEYLGDDAKEPVRRKISRMIYQNPYPRMGAQYKPILLYWSDDMSFKSCHQIANAKAQKGLLPISHYKFAPNLVDRYEYAIESGAMNNGSKGYQELKSLREQMDIQGGGFLAEFSKPYQGYEGYWKAGMVTGLDESGNLVR